MNKQLLLSENITANAGIIYAVFCLSRFFEYCLCFQASDQQQCMKEFEDSGVMPHTLGVRGGRRYRAEVTTVFFCKSATARAWRC